MSEQYSVCIYSTLSLFIHLPVGTRLYVLTAVVEIQWMWEYRDDYISLSLPLDTNPLLLVGIEIVEIGTTIMEKSTETP